MALSGSHRARIGALALAAALVVPAGLALTASPAMAAPQLTISATEVKDGQTVTVKGKGYPSAPTRLFVAICKDPPTATSCDTDLSRVTTVNYDGSGSFTAKYTINTKFDLFGPPAETVNCAQVQCVVGSTNAGNPKDTTYNATAKFTVVSGGGNSGGGNSNPDTEPEPTSGSNGGSGDADLPQTGSSLTPVLALGGAALLLVGGTLVAKNARRRPSPQD